MMDGPSQTEAVEKPLQTLRLVVGLGNPGERYRNTRHNSGFMVADALMASCPDVRKADWQPERGELYEIRKDGIYVVKTVYDPCPFGYKLPNRDVFTGTTTTGRVSAVESEFRVSGRFDNGWHFVVHNDMNDTIFMPATGLRINTWRVEGNTGNGDVGGVCQKGDYWLGTCSSGNAENPHELDFLFYADQIDINNGTGTRGWGFPVRPIADE